MRVALLLDSRNNNSRYLLPLWRMGLKSMGWQEAAPSPAQADAAIMWGMPQENKAILAHWQSFKKPVLVMDYPWWNRPAANRHGKEAWKISIDGLHPIGQLMME